MASRCNLNAGAIKFQTRSITCANQHLRAFIYFFLDSFESISYRSSLLITDIVECFEGIFFFWCCVQDYLISHSKRGVYKPYRIQTLVQPPCHRQPTLQLTNPLQVHAYNSTGLFSFDFGWYSETTSPDMLAVQWFHISQVGTQPWLFNIWLSGLIKQGFWTGDINSPRYATVEHGSLTSSTIWQFWKDDRWPDCSFALRYSECKPLWV